MRSVTAITRLTLTLGLGIFTGCGDSMVSATERVANEHTRLMELMRQCRQERAKYGETDCPTAESAYRERSARPEGDSRAAEPPD